MLKTHHLSAAAAITLALALSACASKPKPQPVATAPQAPAEAPGWDDSRPTLPQSAEALSLQQQLAAAAGDRVFFALDSHTLSDDARAVLAAQAQWLIRNPGVRVMVAGNCDERGTREYNFALGARRASSARDFLVAQGVAAARLQTVSYGKERPIDAGASEDAWSRNRNAGSVVIDLAPL
ncbi:peptidoglycan-associated lipoprotein Pal [Caulobacter sp. RHG1]|uniref:peptidoglycan-associated lipoprotein Pal n=1 Tax=Caulobacter sp. (strain RHG1) TaxID=2545762 RepID=UPI001557623A|nr:peptidoglycan-associated lipoprotein Pal [Caulobacter sp. RHG1]NQE61725.1 Tol-Pal system peptidoglycan-associated lipoprotein PAL [Caulobacter sp. RHG1]